MNRGIESFFREAFDGLKNYENIEARLLIGGSTNAINERKALCVSRFSKVAQILGKMTGRTSYAIEQISSFPDVVREIRTFRPKIIFSSEANLFFLLSRFRSSIGVPYKLLYSNGGPLNPPFHWTDFVQEVAPAYLEAAIKSGASSSRHFLVPYGIHVPDETFTITKEQKKELRKKLGLPAQRKIVISVGWISAQHKRMDYTIREFASIAKEKRPFLLLLGNIDQSSQEIIKLASNVLEQEDYVIRSVPYKEVATYYMASDIFVLSSLKEGFGRVYLEALIYNLPVIAHHHPVMKYVISEQGTLIDLQKQGNLKAAVERLTSQTSTNWTGREYVRQKFGWKVLAAQYYEMFKKVSASEPKVVG